MATSGQSIIAGCGQVVEIYDAITGVLQQSLSASETVTKIQPSPDGSTLFFAHPLSVTMWDVQTGGLIHTFTTQSNINDTAISTMGDYIACGSSDGLVAIWDTRTKWGECFSTRQPVVTICWTSPQNLAIASLYSLYVVSAISCETLACSTFDTLVWGIVYLEDKEELLVGVASDLTHDFMNSMLHSFKTDPHGVPKGRQGVRSGWVPMIDTPMLSATYPGRLMCPTASGEIACMTLPNGVRLISTETYTWTNNPPLLDAATSVAVSLDRNLVAQTKDSIQVFSLDVLTSGETGNDTRPPHIYPLGDNHICVLQPTTGHLALLELETMRELRPGDDASSLGSLLADQSLSASLSFVQEVAAEHRISAVIKAWKSGTPLPGWTEGGYKDDLLSRLSPERTRIVTIYGPPLGEICVKEARYRNTLGELPLGDELEKGEVYDVTFDSETRFHLKIKGPGWHVQIPYDVVPPTARFSLHTITKGEPVHVPGETRAIPFTLDAKREWVHDAEPKKICWIPPGNIRRGRDSHFWAGPSLVMAGDDGVVRKLTFKEPDC